MEKKNRTPSLGSIDNKKDNERFRGKKKCDKKASGCPLASSSSQNPPNKSRVRNNRGKFHSNHNVKNDNDTEIGSVYSKSVKQSNYNHLLNFSYDNNNRDIGSSKHKPARQSQYSSGVIRRRAKLSKDMYLQATCQFILQDNCNTEVYCKDVDSIVDWNLIEKVKMFTNDDPSCPICLGSPIAGKITRCGHIYCTSCILHLIAVVEKCAICDERVKVDHLKSVCTVVQPLAKVNDTITLSLMKRLRTSVFALPVTQWKYEYSNSITSINDEAIEKNFCKYLLISKAEIQRDIIDREKSELEFQLAIAEPSEEMYIKEALRLLVKRSNVDQILQLGSVADNVVTQPNIQYTSQDEDLSEYSFYRASNGEHIYLHSMNTRCLKSAFGSLEQSPLDITAKILAIENHTMSEELRRRYRFLSNLPLMCEFKIVELEFNSNLIPVEILSQFTDEISKRRKQRNRKIKEETNRCHKIQIEENKILGKFPEMKLSINNIEEFPEPCELTPKSPEKAELQISNCSSKSSFSQMLSTGSNTFSSEIRSSSSQYCSDSAPSYRAAFSLDIQQALDSYNDSKTVDQSNITENVGCKGKKKKKAKSKLLFSTDMSRG